MTGGHSGGYGHGHDGGGHGFGGHTTMQALIVSYAHGAGAGHIQFTLGHVGREGSFGHTGTDFVAVDRQNDGRRNKYGMPTVGEDGVPLCGYEVHVTGHGEASLPYQLIKMTQRAGLICLDKIAAGLDSGQQVMTDIEDWNASIPGADDGSKPSGWYPGATGITTYLENNWQLAKPSWKIWGEPQRDPRAKYQLETRITTWHFKGYQETRFDVRVITNRAEWVTDIQDYVLDDQQFLDYQEAATCLAKHVLDLLTTTPPSDAGMMILQYIASHTPEPQPDPHREGMYDESREQMEAEDAADVAEDKATDAQVVADVSSTQMGSTTTTPPDDSGGDDDGDDGDFEADDVVSLPLD